MPWVPVHKTWQTNLCWQMDPLVLSSSGPDWQLADIRADLPPPQHWHLVVKNFNITLPLTSSGQEWQFHIPTDILLSRMAFSHCYWQLVVKNDNFTLLLTSSGQEWQFHIATDIYWSIMAISHCYWHLVVKNGNFTLLLTSSGQEWQFHIAIDI